MRLAIALVVAVTPHQEDRKLVLTLEGDSNFGSWSFSDDGEHWLLGFMRGMTGVVVVDGKEISKGYDANYTTARLSADGRHWAFVDCAGKIVVDGKELGTFKRASQLTLSATYGRCAFVYGEEGKRRVVIDGKESGPFEDASYVRLSADGTHSAFAIQRNKKMLLVLDGQEKSEHDWIWGLEISGDGKHHALVANTGRASSVLLDGKELGVHNEFPRALVLSADGSHCGYVARTKGQWGLWLDGREVMQVGAAEPAHVRFTPSLDHHLVVVRGNADSTVYRDAKEVGTFPRVEGATLSPDGRHFALCSQKGLEGALILDGQGTHANVLVMSPVFIDGGKRLRYVSYEVGKKVFVVTRRL